MFWKKKKVVEAGIDGAANAARGADGTPGAEVPAAAAPVALPAAAPTGVEAPTTSPASGAPLETGRMREGIVEKLREVFDPEIPVNIYELGLVYKIDVDAEGRAKIEMTLTSPACPSAAEIPVEVRRKAESVEGVRSAEVEIVWDPPWTMEFMSEAARVQLGFY